MTDRDDRKSFRCPVADTRQQCELKVGRDMLSARLLDESAGGFAVLVERLAGIEVEQIIHLRTNSGAFIVRVVHVAEVVLPDDDETPVGSEASWFRLGLLRVGEAEPTRAPTTSLWADTLRCQLSHRCPGSGMLMILGVLLAIIAVALPMEFLAGDFFGGQSGAYDRTTESKREKPLPNLAPPRAEQSPFSNGNSDSSGGRSAFDNDSSFSADHGRTQQSNPSASSEKKWHETARRLPGASAFTMPEVVQELQLTADQQKQIHQLIEATSQAIQALDRQLKGQQRQQISARRAELFGQARREALGILTVEQRAQWQKLTEGR